MSNDILTHTFPPNLENIWDKEMAYQLAATQGALSGLDQAVSLLHNPNLLMRPLLGKEAESSSRLEGTQASVEDVYRAEVQEDPEKRDDVREIVNYQQSMLRGLGSVRTRPLDQVVIRQLHRTLMTGVRGESKNPGRYRTGPVWIGVRGTGAGEARYVPPDAVHVPGLMDNLEKFIAANELHPLIACGVLHHRFEAVHPFQDGNGRTGRLLITLYLIKLGLLSEPMLYPSGYFDKNKEAYMDALHAVDTHENWQIWLMYFLKGIEVQAKLSLGVAREIDACFKKNRHLIEDETARIGLIKVLEYCFVQPYVTVRLVSRRLKIPEQTVRRYLPILEAKGVIKHADTLARNERLYSNSELLTILRKI